MSLLRPAVQRGMSGMRRYISFRRKDTKRRREAEQEAVDHRKSTAEEEQIKVGGGGVLCVWGSRWVGGRVWRCPWPAGCMVHDHAAPAPAALHARMRLCGAELAWQPAPAGAHQANRGAEQA